MSRHKQGLKIDFQCFFGAFSTGQLEIEFKSSTPASMLPAATTSCLALFKRPFGLKGTVSLLVIPNLVGIPTP